MTQPNTKVIEFPRHRMRERRTSHDTGMRIAGTEIAPAGVTSPLQTDVEGSAAKSIEIDTLYPHVEDSKEYISKALEQLATAVSLLGSARSEKDPIIADRYVQRFQALLPELFKWRSIGDGYGVIINSLHFVFVNQKGVPLSGGQLTTLWRVLKEVRTRPFLSFDQAMTYVDEIEKAGLSVDPAVLAELLPDDETDE